jgi:hypothetical protein
MFLKVDGRVGIDPEKLLNPRSSAAKNENFDRSGSWNPESLLCDKLRVETRELGDCGNTPLIVL